MGLRDTYAYAIQTAKGKFHGNAEERDGKLYFKGTVATDAEKNELWNAIKANSIYIKGEPGHIGRNDWHHAVAG